MTEYLTEAEMAEHDRDYAAWSAWCERQRADLLDLARACGWEDRPVRRTASERKVA